MRTGITTIREKANPVRAGIIIGSAETRIALVNDQNKIISRKSFATDTSKSPKDFISYTAEETVKLLSENNIPLDQCIGVGVGVPGTVDRRSGKVIYSNNIRWNDVALRNTLSRVIPCPVRIANNADCAALGEATAGAGKDYSDVGHMVVRHNGRQCTCGRKGCLEAYASRAALLKQVKERAGIQMTAGEVFENQEDLVIKETLQEYTEMLAAGVVNIVNLFRPQLILLGGAMSGHTTTLIPKIREIMENDCFGGIYGSIPEIATAQLGDDAGVIGAANL